MALAAATQESLYLVNLLNGIDNQCEYAPVKIHEDNQVTIALSKDPVCRQRSKHIDMRYHCVPSALGDGKITTEFCPTAHIVADTLTKFVTELSMDKFVHFVFGE